jgi:hypothetical protein
MRVFRRARGRYIDGIAEPRHADATDFQNTKRHFGAFAGRFEDKLDARDGIRQPLELRGVGYGSTGKQSTGNVTGNGS